MQALRVLNLIEQLIKFWNFLIIYRFKFYPVHVNNPYK